MSQTAPATSAVNPTMRQGRGKSASSGSPGGTITDTEISTWIDWLTRNGELEEGKLKPSDIYTNEFNPYANGTYSPDSGADGQALEAAK